MIDVCDECSSVESFRTRLVSAQNQVDYEEEVYCEACGAGEESRTGYSEDDPREDR